MFGAQKFDIRIQIIAIAVALFLMLGTLELVRRRKLGEVYSIIWLMLGSMILVLALFRDLQETLARWMGVYYPPSLIFGILSFLQLGVILYLSMVLTRLETSHCILMQRLALLEQHVYASPEDSDPQ